MAKWRNIGKEQIHNNNKNKNNNSTSTPSSSAGAAVPTNEELDGGSNEDDEGSGKVAMIFFINSVSSATHSLSTLFMSRSATLIPTCSSAGWMDGGNCDGAYCSSSLI